MKLKNTVYIGNMCYKFDEYKIKNLFSKYGKVLKVNLVKTPGTDKSKGFAFVDMEKRGSILSIIEKLDGKEMGGRKLKVSEAIDNKAAPLVERIKELDSKKFKAEEVKENIVFAKKERRRTGLQELFDNTRK